MPALALLAAAGFLDAFDHEGYFHMGASLHQAQFAYLREGAVATRTRVPAEGGGVGRRIRHVQDRAVESHQPPTLVEGSRCLRRGQRADEPLEQAAAGGTSPRR